TTFFGTGYNDGYQQTARSFALFTNETWNIIQGLDLTLGLRGTEEKKTATASYNSVGMAPGCSALLGAPGLFTPPLAGTNAQAFVLGYGCYTGLNPFFAGT